MLYYAVATSSGQIGFDIWFIWKQHLQRKSPCQFEGAKRQNGGKQQSNAMPQTIIKTSDRKHRLFGFRLENSLIYIRRRVFQDTRSHNFIHAFPLNTLGAFFRENSLKNHDTRRQQLWFNFKIRWYVVHNEADSSQTSSHDKTHALQILNYSTIIPFVLEAQVPWIFAQHQCQSQHVLWSMSKL